MKNKKMIMALAITLMAIGFASVSTVLYLNGQTFVAGNTGDFDVYFSKVVENGTENNNIIKDKKHLEFTTELNEVGDTYILNYTVTNGSKNYDATIKVNYTGETSEYLSITNNIDTVSPLKARETRDGRIIIKLIKGVLEEKQFTISYEIVGSAVERDTVGGDEIRAEDINYLAVVRESGTPEHPYISGKIEPYFGYEMDRDKVESITIMNSKEAPADSTLVGDVSEKQNGSILMYSKDEDNDNMLELYIGQDGGVVANPNSNSLFASFTYLESINGLENLDINYVTNMSFMFAGCGKLTTLDISHFDTSQVTNMSGMFRYCFDLTALDVSHFDTSQVTDMSSMFSCDNLETLDVSNFDTSNVTNMSDMFYRFSGVTDLDLSHFDTSKVTDMSWMFSGCYKLTTTITIRGTKCTSYSSMFDDTATFDGAQITVNYTADASDLVDKMIATKSYNSNVIKGTQVA